MVANIGLIERRLWEATDELRANSNRATRTERFATWRAVTGTPAMA